MDEPWSLPRVVVAAAGAALIAALLWRWAGLRFNLRIIIRSGEVSVGGSALTGRRGAVVEFFRQDLPVVRRALVLGSWDGRRVRILYCTLARPQRQRSRRPGRGPGW